MREEWLNGWKRYGNIVLVGAMTTCVGCGKPNGMVCLALDEEHLLPDKHPDFPFDTETCPVCSANLEGTFTTEELAELGQSKLRQALIVAKRNDRRIANGK